MITKDTFIEIMNTLRDYYDSLTKFENSLDTVFENNWLINILDGILNALFNELEAGNNGDSLIYTFAFTCDWGRDEGAKGIKVNGICCGLDSAENLYDLLLALRKNKR